MIKLTNKNWLLAISNLKKKDRILKEIINKYKSEKLHCKKKCFFNISKINYWATNICKSCKFNLGKIRKKNKKNKSK